jgi:hypothetical protein
MNRLLLTALAGALMLEPLAASAAAGKPAGAQQATNQIDMAHLSGALVDAALRLPAGALENDYLQAFLAEISASGAPQVVVLSAIDKAVGAQGLPKGAVQALEALRKRSRQTERTAALSTDGAVFGSPAFTGGGGSDYTR